MPPLIAVLTGSWLAICGGADGAPPPVPFAVPAGLPDRAEVLSPAQVHLDGWLGARVDANEKNRLLVVDMEPLLAGYRKRPGSHPWIGEHVGKWLHAATLAWVYTGDAALKAKLDRVAADLIACKEPDGYLGTYVPEKRFGLYREADWDVWSHKYNLIGLLTYYQYTGNGPALDCCRKMADLLIATFPGKKSILKAGTHVGMAATSVLEPVVLLYRLTGDRRYLEFAHYIVKSWDEPGGPAIAATLRAALGVNRTANGKAYEMLSNLVGLCELARADGDRALLQPVLNAWQDIVDKRLYLTGSASAGELFRDDHILPNQPGRNIGETCVTTTWIQLNLQLLRLTGMAKFGNEIERSLYNHLAAAQHPRGDDWCYYTALEGKKPYDSGITCCHSSGPRGMALAPQSAYLKWNQDGAEALAVSTFESSRARLILGGQEVTCEQFSEFPRSGRSEITMHLARPAKFGLLVRQAPWAGPLVVSVGGVRVEAQSQDGWSVIPAREWKDGDRLSLAFRLALEQTVGDYGNRGRVAYSWGPFVLAVDPRATAGLPAGGEPGFHEARSGTIGASFVIRAAHSLPHGKNSAPAVFVSFADAGATGGRYVVWVPLDPNISALLAQGEESRSRPGNQDGSINDGDRSSFVVTFDGAKAGEDWYAVTLAKPARINRVAFTHGQNFHDGGWFDTSGGKPRVQLQKECGGAWQSVGELTGYPATTATDGKALEEGGTFELRLAMPMLATAIRVVGVPSCGDNPNQAFSSCGEIEAFSD